MKYIVTEGVFDSYVISNLFKDEIKDCSWIPTPIGGGISEAVSLAESLAYRHKGGEILLIIDSDSDIDENNFNVKRIRSRLDDYENIKIVFSVPNIECEINHIINLGVFTNDPFGLKTKNFKKEVQEKTKKLLSKGGYKINETSFYKNIKEVLRPQPVVSQ